MRRKQTKTRSIQKSPSGHSEKLPFVEHFYELRRRLVIVAVSVFGFACAAYIVQMHIVELLLRPAQGQNLIYTTPGGGLDFLLRVCLYTGVVFSLPVIVYQILKYLEPLFGSGSVRFALKGSLVSALLAGVGVAFGYLVGLPSALNFLLHQFNTSQINPLITIHSYMSFVTMYMLGAAMLFQIPLIMVLINRIKPLSPRALFRKERWMIVGAFILAAIMNPSPGIIDQLLLAGPMILMYQVGIGLIAIINRPKRSQKVLELLARDAEIQAERLAKAATAKTHVFRTEVQAIIDQPQEIIHAVEEIIRIPRPTPRPLATPATLQRSRPAPRTHYANDIVGGRNRTIPVTFTSSPAAEA